MADEFKELKVDRKNQIIIRKGKYTIMKYAILFSFLLFTIISGKTVDHSLFNEILDKYNYGGNVDYQGLKTEPKLDLYLQILSSTDPDKLKDDNEKIAFWINVYNAFTIKAVADNYPIESINDLHKGGRILGHILSTTIWDEDFIGINGKKYSLNDVEHEILRKDFNEPRIHFAIVCASISCPVLRNEAFTAEKLEDQLQDQSLIFFNDRTKNKFDTENNIAYISKILDWFEEDFGNNEQEVLIFVSNFTDEETASDIRNNRNDWSIDYLSYDWGLNDHKKE
jgi:hypothetical protein